MLRAIQCGFSVADLKLISIGMIRDVLVEKGNDNYEYPVLASQEDMDRL